MDEAVTYLVNALVETMVQLICLGGVCGAAAVVLHQLDLLINAVLTSAFSIRARLYWTGWLGTPIHELSHAVVGLLFGFKIKSLRLWRPMAPDGCLGRVEFSYNPALLRCQIGKAFIGIAPIFGGALAMALAKHLLIDPPPAPPFDGPALSYGMVDQVHAAISATIAAVEPLWDPRHLSDGRYWIFLYLVACIGSHLAPSAEDLKHSAAGFAVIVVGLTAFNAAIQAVGAIPDAVLFSLTKWISPIAAILMFAAVLNTITLVGTLAIALVWTRLATRHPWAPLSALGRRWPRLLIIAVILTGGLGLLPAP